MLVRPLSAENVFRWHYLQVHNVFLNADDDGYGSSGDNPNGVRLLDILGRDTFNAEWSEDGGNIWTIAVPCVRSRTTPSSASHDFHSLRYFVALDTITGKQNGSAATTLSAVDLHQDMLLTQIGLVCEEVPRL